MNKLMNSIRIWNLRSNDTNELTKQKETHRLKRTKLWLPWGNDVGKG